jgi:hypothetical protein
MCQSPEGQIILNKRQSIIGRRYPDALKRKKERGGWVTHLSFLLAKIENRETNILFRNILFKYSIEKIIFHAIVYAEFC